MCARVRVRVCVRVPLSRFVCVCVRFYRCPCRTWPLPGCPHVGPVLPVQQQQASPTWPTWSGFNPLANRRSAASVAAPLGLVPRLCSRPARCPILTCGSGSAGGGGGVGDCSWQNGQLAYAQLPERQTESERGAALSSCKWSMLLSGLNFSRPKVCNASGQRSFVTSTHPLVSTAAAVVAVFAKPKLPL